jgi:glycosyltransferase involved in cell wall biosynthesis
MRLVYGAYPLGPQPTGTGVYLREMLRALTESRPDWQLRLHGITLRHASAYEATVASVDTSERLELRLTRAPSGVIRPAEHYLHLPPTRWFVGPFDIYHQLHLDADPAVPSSRLVVTVHDTVALMWPREEGPLSRYTRPLLARAAAVVTVSEYSRDVIVDELGVEARRITVVPNGIDHARFNPKDAAAGEAAMRAATGVQGHYVLHVGGHTSRKNVVRLASAFILAKDALGYDGSLVLAGPAVDPSSELGIMMASRSDIIELGFVDDRHLPGLMFAADAVAYPSLCEGFGLPVLEAMAVGTPVLTSSTTALAETGGSAAMFVDPSETGAIADGLIALLSENHVERSSRVERGLAHSSRYSWSRTAHAVARLYEDLAAS